MDRQPTEAADARPVEEPYQPISNEMLLDGGLASLDAMDAAENRGGVVDAPVKDEEQQTKAGQDSYARTKADRDRRDHRPVIERRGANRSKKPPRG